MIPDMIVSSIDCWWQINLFESMGKHTWLGFQKPKDLSQLDSHQLKGQILGILLLLCRRLHRHLLHRDHVLELSVVWGARCSLLALYKP